MIGIAAKVNYWLLGLGAANAVALVVTFWLAPTTVALVAAACNAAALGYVLREIVDWFD